jgi:RimJ/RimL family protein N-acetyltransferase
MRTGYAYEALKELLRIVSKHTIYHPILSTTLPSNKNSIKLLTKLRLHFQKEIEVRNGKLLVLALTNVSGK